MSDALIIEKRIPFEKHTNKTLAVIGLNRPKALNSLNLEMVTSLYTSLKNIEQDESVAAVFLYGEGERAFCAGGDVKEMYYSALENPGGPCTTAEAFFNQEYLLDYLIHTFNKPIFAWGHAVVMGGGLGLLQGATFRLGETNAVFAMPEVTIALFPDVAANYFLNKLPEPWGRFMALTGASINVSEAQTLDLLDAIVTTSRDAYINNLLALDEIDQQSFNAFVQAQAANQDLPASRLDEYVNECAQIFAEATPLHEVIAKAKTYLQNEQDSWFAKALQTMLAGSPISVCNSDRAFFESKNKSLLDVFKNDLVLATNCVRHPEFAEGVRALLIDKDKQPKWLYESIEDVPVSLLDDLRKLPWSSHPFDDLT